MYRVEMILRDSVEADIIKQWLGTRRKDTRENGQVVFDDVQSVDIDNGVITIYKDMNTYHYNVQDFYRIKTIYIQ